MSKRLSRRVIILTATALLLLIAAFFFFRSSANAPAGYVKVDGYKPPGKISCLALMPECGYCAGKVIDDGCYVKKSEAQ